MGLTLSRFAIAVPVCVLRDPDTVAARARDSPVGGLHNMGLGIASLALCDIRER